MKRIASRVPSTERRKQILAVATQLFARQGFRGTTTRQIAARARVNEAILFRHFPRKQDLYWAVIDEKCRARSPREFLVEQLAAATTDRERFAAIARGILERNTADPSLTRLLLFSALEEHALSDRFFQTYIATYFATLADFIRQRIRARVFRSVDPVLAARSFLGMVFYHFLTQEIFGASQYHQFELQHVSETLADIWLKGMQTK